jgi:predicted nicotinamide N-methyase
MTVDTKDLDTHEYQLEDKVIQVSMDPIGKLKAGTGATVWDSCVVLAKYFEKAHKTYSPRVILELGAGTGLLSIVLGILFPNSQVVSTDLSSVVPLLQHNIDNSKIGSIVCKEFDFTAQHPVDVHPDMIVMSDLITWPELYDSLVATLDRLASKDTIVLFSHESRSFEKEAHFYARLSKHFTFRHLKPEELDSVYQSEDIYVFIAKKK